MKKAFVKSFITFFITALLMVAAGCKKDTTTATVMLIHASPGITDVDFYLQDDLKQSHIMYGTNSSYHQTTVETDVPFSGQIKISDSDDFVSSIYDPAWLDGKKYSLVLYGPSSDPENAFFPDEFQAPPSGGSKVRFIHLSPDAPALDVLANGLEVVTNKVYYGDNSFNGSTDFSDVISGSYTIDFRLTGTTTIILSVPHVVLEKGKAYTLYAKGYLYGTGEEALDLGIAENN